MQESDYFVLRFSGENQCCSYSTHGVDPCCTAAVRYDREYSNLDHQRIAISIIITLRKLKIWIIQIRMSVSLHASVPASYDASDMYTGAGQRRRTLALFSAWNPSVSVRPSVSPSTKKNRRRQTSPGYEGRHINRINS